jgi:PleD family two-component response regulator
VIRSQEFKHNSVSAKVTARAGVAGFHPDQGEEKMEDLLRLVSDALRSADGPDRVEIYSF